MRSRAILASLLAIIAIDGCGGGADSTDLPAVAQGSARADVFVIVLENHSFGQVIGNPEAPFVNGLTKTGTLFTDYRAITHPSLPNYLAILGGSTFGIEDDCTDCAAKGDNLALQLSRAGTVWRAYMEGMPRACFGGASSPAGYAKKHDPFMYYDDVARNPRRCRKVVPFDQLASDLRRGTLPTFSFISPNLCDDTHDCDIATGDRFLAGLVPRLLRETGPHGFVILTWDEGTSDDGCCVNAHGGRIATIVAGPDVRRHASSARPIDHYGVLRTIDDALGLPPLGGAALHQSGRLQSLFVRPAHLR